ncbi:signal peptidase II [Solicola sp. PLA-1-18]|uniref:signal peptidase II n=1 Tax=Solicola sp. PLA-1-18 TaxID=3380532 RepID=UPI003B7CFF20
MQTARGASLNPSDDDRTESQDPTSAPPRRRRLRLFALVLVTVYVVDLVTKIVAVDRLEGRPPVEVVPGVLDLTLIRNPGAAFGMATGFTIVLSAIAIVVCVVVAVVARRLRSAVWALALGLLLGGALGNLTDRMFRQPGPLRGHVIDFLALPNWPVFNIADSSIVVAACLVALQSFRGIGVDGRKVSDDAKTGDAKADAPTKDEPAAGPSKDSSE